jgi:4-hydroxyphenylacetaldehyde oxime monooxygenase
MSAIFTQLPKQWQLLLGLLLPAVLSLLVIVRRWSAGKGLNLPPGPARLPVLGNLHQLGPLPHRSLRELARRHGPVMLLRLGARRMLVVSSASAAREVLKTQDADCCSRPAWSGAKVLTYGFNDVLFGPYGEGWRERRKVLVSELLSMRGVKAAWGARQEQVDILMAALTNGSSKPVALGELIYGLADGIIGTVAFGSVYGKDKLAGKKRQLQNVFYEAMHTVGNCSEDFFPNAAGRLVDSITGMVTRREQIFSQLDAFFEMVIEEHLKPGRDKGGDLVDALVNLWKEGRGMTRDHIKAIILVC